MAENRGSEVAGVAIFFGILSTIFVAMRVYCRATIVKSFGLDDYLAVLAQILYIHFCAFAITGVQYGTGQHAWDIKPPTNIPIGLKWWWACEPVYVLCGLFLKWSIGIFLLRIAVTKTHRAIIHFAMGINTVISLYFFFLFVFQCWPVRFFWEQYTGLQGKCINPEIIVNSTWVYSAVSCVVDWTLCILPGFMVWNLQMNPRTKISVCVILALSAIASAATIIRLPYVPGLKVVEDFLYATTDVAIWSINESGLAITASSAATLRPLFRNFFARSRLFGSSEGTGRNRDGTHASAWPMSRRSGYLRSHGPDSEMGLRSDIKASTGITTLVDGRNERERAKSVSSDETKNVSSQQVGRDGWNNSQSKLTDGSSEEFASVWQGAGITKTTVVSSSSIRKDGSMDM